MAQGLPHNTRQPTPAPEQGGIDEISDTGVVLDDGTELSFELLANIIAGLCEEEESLPTFLVQWLPTNLSMIERGFEPI